MYHNLHNNPTMQTTVLRSEYRTDTIIISDLHLGSEVARSRELADWLRAAQPRRLILNGDVFDDLNFKRLSKHDWKLLSLIRKMSHPKRGCEIVWVAGNHDGVAEMLSHLLGVEVVDEYRWQHKGMQCLAIHGHQFDDFICRRVIITAMATKAYLWMQRWGGPEQRLSRWAKRSTKTWLRISDTIANRAIAYARLSGADVVFCGHTHIPMHITTDGVQYFNSGCWTDVPATAIVTDTDGNFRIAEFDADTHHLADTALHRLEQ